MIYFSASITTVAIHSLNNLKHKEHIKQPCLSRDQFSNQFCIDCEVDTSAGRTQYPTTVQSYGRVLRQSVLKLPKSSTFRIQ